MHISSFVDVISSDSMCAKYTLVELVTKTDLFSGEVESYSSNVPKGASAENSVEGVQRLRERITSYLSTQESIILIDHRKEKIFSNIQEDPFFARLVENVEYGFKKIDENMTIAKIIQKAFPLPKKGDEPCQKRRCECILL